MPISDKLLKKVMNKYYNAVFNITETESSDNESIDFFSSSDFEDDDDDDDLSRTNSNSDQDLSEDSSSENSDYDFDFDFGPNTYVRSKTKSSRVESYPKKMCYDNRSNEYTNKLVVKLDGILVRTNVLEKYLKIVKHQPKPDNLAFELIINKLDLTIHSEHSSLVNETFNPVAQVIYSKS